MLVALTTQAQNDSDEMTGNTSSLPDGKVMLGTYYADRFVGTLIHFGSPTFPDWPAVEKFLRSPEAGVTKP